VASHAIAVGDEIKCPYCDGWHMLTPQRPGALKTELKPLFFECNGKRHFAGMAGQPIRHDTRPKAS